MSNGDIPQKWLTKAHPVTSEKHLCFHGYHVRVRWRQIKSTAEYAAHFQPTIEKVTDIALHYYCRRVMNAITGKKGNFQFKNEKNIFSLMSYTRHQNKCIASGLSTSTHIIFDTFCGVNSIQSQCHFAISAIDALMLQLDFFYCYYVAF